MSPGLIGSIIGNALARRGPKPTPTPVDVDPDPNYDDADLDCEEMSVPGPSTGQLDAMAGTGDLVQWNGKDLIVLLPSYKTVSPHTHYTLFANYARYGPSKIGLDFETRTVVHEARNILVDRALKNSDSKFIAMVDDDMILPFGNADLMNRRYKANLPKENAGLLAFSRMMSHPEDKRIVGTLYFGRTEDGKAQVCSAFANENESRNYREFKYKGLREESWVATGFIRIHRSVFDDLKKAIDDGMFPECKPKHEGGRYGYFNPTGVGVGEDVSFGRRCEKIGIKSYVDASLIALHEGVCFYGPKNTKG